MTLLPLTQYQIDRPGMYFPVKKPDLPIRIKTFPEDPDRLNYESSHRKPPLSKVMLPLSGYFEWQDGDRSECIPGAEIIRVLRRMAEKQGKPVKVVEVKPEGRAMKLIGKSLLVFGGLYFAVHILIWAVK